jgi:L-ascorbate metabolism protein UlaG (beta-lactamase superfamily)
MKLHHLRNATLLLTLGEHRLLVDPMLAARGEIFGFKLFGGGRRRNPLVDLPPDARSVLEQATGVVLTHEHPDHFDAAALAFVRERRLPVWANAIDLPHLAQKGLDVRELRDGALGMAVEIIPSRHGRGLLGWLLGPVAGYYLAHPGEPSVYLTGDTILTEAVLETVERLRPDVVVAPAGAANMGLGGDILLSVDELVELVRRAPGQVVLNHLEALDHCPTTREGLRARLDAEGLGGRVHIPEDGEQLSFDVLDADDVRPEPRADHARAPGFQKWLTARFAMARPPA